MKRRGTDLSNPDEEPPFEARSEILWRLSVRLFRDHHEDAAARLDSTPRCGRCRQPWPCSGRRLAELGLIHAAG